MRKMKYWGNGYETFEVVDGEGRQNLAALSEELHEAIIAISKWVARTPYLYDASTKTVSVPYAENVAGTMRTDSDAAKAI